MAKPSARNRRVAHRLAAARRDRFIGRDAELALFRSALAAKKPPFTVLHVHGPGGVGKTTLLRELARAGRRAGRTVLALDARDIEPSRPALIRALGEALERKDVADRRRVALPPRSLVLIDTYERLAVLDAWLRDHLLPAWPDRVVVVLAGREPPAMPWRTDVSWAPLTHILELGNFASAESAAFLAARGVAASARPAAVDFTRGHPLALSLVADLLARRRARAFDPGQAPDVVKHLLGLFLESVPQGRRREALEVCAIARVTTERLLVELFGAEEGGAAFQWLRDQPFMESGARGVFPHDLVRELLIAEARWRDETALRLVSRRVYRALQGQIREARSSHRQRLQMDALYVTRVRPTNAGFFDWGALDEVRVEPAQADDAAWIAALVERHEGAAAARLAREWWRRQPSAFHVFRRADEVRFGFLALLDLSDGSATVAVDPAVPPARAFVERHGPVRRGEGVVHLRWWMHAELYQAVTAAINLTAMHVVSHCLTRPGIAWNFVAMADPAFWTPHFDGVNFPRASEAGFEVGGRRYGVFAHDWRVEPAADWMMGAGIAMPFAEVGTDGASPPRALAEPEFRRAVRAALRHYTRLDTLAESPLRGARLLQDSREGPPRTAALQRLLREAVESLRANSRDLKLHRALWHTYLEPLPTQEAAAERLDVPFSTYRHHLARGIDRVTAWLWQRERAAPRT